MPCINTILSVIYFFIIISLLLFCTTATDCHFNCIVLLVQLLGLIHLYLQGQLGYGEVMQYCTECISFSITQVLTSQPTALRALCDPVELQGKMQFDPCICAKCICGPHSSYIELCKASHMTKNPDSII